MLDTAALIEQVGALVQPWADFYADSPKFSTGVIAAHLLAIFVGGGMAIGADRTLLRAKPATAAAVRGVVDELGTMHSVVLTSLALAVCTGLALLASDVGNFAVSRVYWIKMGTFVLLLLNGMRMQRAERAAALATAQVTPTDTELPFPVQPWARLRSAAVVSMILWISIVLLGVVLTNG